MNPFSGILGYVCGALLIAVIGLGIYCKFLRDDNIKYIQESAAVAQINKDQATSLKTCSDGTQALKDAADKQSKDAVAAVEQAKKDAVSDYVASTKVLIRPPKPPVVTKDNSKNFGGWKNTDDQIRDYLETHDLMNDYINNRKAKEVK